MGAGWAVEQGGRVGGDPAGRPGNQLFANDGNGHFADRSAKSGAEDRGYGMGCAAGDADGDGRRHPGLRSF